MSKYGLLDPGTCLPVLEAICHVYEIDHALEFGCGIWSTFCLTRNCKTLTSIENVEEWVEHVKDEYSHKENLDIIHWTNSMNEYLKETDRNFDLIFIDGNERLECLNDAIGRAPIIVCHDTHQKDLGWADGKIGDYKQLTYAGCLPYLTTIFYQPGINLKDMLFDINNYSHKGTFIDHNFWTEENIIEHYKLV